MARIELFPPRTPYRSACSFSIANLSIAMIVRNMGDADGTSIPATLVRSFRNLSRIDLCGSPERFTATALPSLRDCGDASPQTALSVELVGHRQWLRTSGRPIKNLLQSSDHGL